ncbi:hypothetical protein [Carboxylicivirga sp. M1479]|uniref:hypothetical protein n=1 Tax=Carboxylicivirga sp. M1479 TaxID=2594476 RepID=UPI0011779758|nr:hypothetical protein [Carboxylicivirga sp. M1479]TRX66299.1 hypothetical protein FNN09_13910 [Carboxylicivirga sp. M1479]
MKQFVIYIVLCLMSVGASAQDFSYLSDLDVKDESQAEETKEAALECCCYLTGVRYDKKDESRSIATKFVQLWLNEHTNTQTNVDVLLGNDECLMDMYSIYFAMHFIDDENSQSVRSLQASALEGVVSYCSNSSNKLKFTKALKEIKALSQKGELEQVISNMDLVSSVQ